MPEKIAVRFAVVIGDFLNYCWFFTFAVLIAPAVTEFQSTRLQEARLRLCTFRAVRRNFNPRACKRRDLFAFLYFAPTIYFNPRACKRRDMAYWDQIRKTAKFQSTRLQEARQVPQPQLGAGQSISIHAPARGATPPSSPDSYRKAYFNPRACKRRDLFALTLKGTPLHFNPRACKRRDVYGLSFRMFTVRFQSTRLQEARRCRRIRSILLNRNFNPRACKRRDRSVYRSVSNC